MRDFPIISFIMTGELHYHRTLRPLGFTTLLNITAQRQWPQIQSDIGGNFARLCNQHPTDLCNVCKSIQKGKTV